MLMLFGCMTHAAELVYVRCIIALLVSCETTTQSSTDAC